MDLDTEKFLEQYIKKTKKSEDYTLATCKFTKSTQICTKIAGQFSQISHVNYRK